MSPVNAPQPTEKQMAQLSRLADGTLDPRHAAELEALIATSPEMKAVYERELLVVQRLREARAEDRAPTHLRARVAAQRPRKSLVVRNRIVQGGVLAGALAAVALALVALLPGGTPGSPAVSQAAALALRGPTQGPPVPDRIHPAIKLERRLEGLYFPNLGTSLGWRPVGQRSDRLGGRQAVTVYYERAGMRVAYTILSVPAITPPAAPVTHRSGFALRTLKLGGRTVITWRRAGHTCVLSAAGVSAATLQRLAAWRKPAVHA